MSKETHSWLSNNTLIGFTEKRGNAWHYREGDGNHYVGPIPVEDVRSRLFAWTAEEKALFVKSSGPSEGTMEVPDRKAIVRSDNGHVLGIFKSGYQPHQFGEWLIDNVGKIIDDDLMIGSAGLLKGGAVAWVSVEVPDSITTPEGVEFRPFLLAASSLDGSIATQYKPVVTNVVCDNTMRAGLSEAGAVFKIKSTVNSLKTDRIAAARDALGIVYATGDAFAEEVKALCAQDFNDRAFERLVNDLTPFDPTAKSPRGATMAEKKRGELWDLWYRDERVAPWSGTAYGALQAVNTHRHHFATVKGTGRAERNMLNAVNGKTEDEDADTMRRVVALA